MKAMAKVLGISVLVVGLVGVALGIVFLQQSFSKSAMIKERMAAEQVTLGLPAAGEPGYIEGNVVDTAGEAQVASDTLREHRMDSYGTYGDTARGSAERTSFLDALNMENSLNLAQAGFGISTMALGSGVFMIVMGVGLMTTGTTLYYLSRRMS